MINGVVREALAAWLETKGYRVGEGASYLSIYVIKLPPHPSYIGAFHIFEDRTHWIGSKIMHQEVYFSDPDLFQIALGFITRTEEHLRESDL